MITMPYAHCKGILLGTLTMEMGGEVNIHHIDSISSIFGRVFFRGGGFGDVSLFPPMCLALEFNEY